MTDDDRRRDVALFRLAVLGDLIHVDLRRGELGRALQKKSQELWRCPDGKSRSFAAKTIQSWLYAYKRDGFDALRPKPRSDKGVCRAIPLELQRLILDMKREDPGRSVALIERELVDAGLMRLHQFSESAITRLLARHGLSGPKLELEVPARHRFVAATCNELWQGDACHGLKLFHPSAGREVRVKIFGLLDDKSRLITHLRADFHERQEDFLRVLHEAVRRRGLPRAVLLDNHGSFTGADARVACAQLGIRLTYARPYDGASKGKIERFWRTLRGHVLDRLDLDRIHTLDDLNVRLSTWVSGEYNVRPHSGLGGRTPLDVFEEDADEIRFVDDHQALEAAFVARIERAVRADSTCSVAGETYEVPAHLRGRKVTLCYDVLHPSVLWIDDAGTKVPVRIVDAVANSRRSRVRPGTPPAAPAAPTGLNAVEGTLGRLLRPETPESDDEEDVRKLLNRFGLTAMPFTKEIDTEDLFATSGHEAAVARLKAAVEARASAVLTGEAGVGKTCLIRSLERELNPARVRLTYIHNANVSARDFYRQLSMALGLEPKAHPSALFRQVQAHVEELADEHKVHPVILLDEAHLLPVSLLEQLHVLLNYRMDSRAFLSVILIGLPELRDRLARNILGSLSTRLPVRVHLEPLAAEQIGAYLHHRMNHAGCAQEVFSEDAALSIREATGGVLRKVDVLAWHCLEVAMDGRKGSLVDGGIVQSAVRVCAEALR